MIPVHQAARYMECTTLIAACLVAVAAWAVAVFLRDELEAMAKRAWHRIACAWMQCDEAL